MKDSALIILLAAVALSVAVTALSHGQIVLIALPFLLGAPVAAFFGSRRR